MWGCVELKSGTRGGGVDKMKVGFGIRSVQTCCTVCFGRGTELKSGTMAGGAPRGNRGRRIMSVQVAGFKVFETLTEEVQSRSRTVVGTNEKTTFGRRMGARESRSGSNI